MLYTVFGCKKTVLILMYTFVFILGYSRQYCEQVFCMRLHLRLYFVMYMCLQRHTQMRILFVWRHTFLFSLLVQQSTHFSMLSNKRNFLNIFVRFGGYLLYKKVIVKTYIFSVLMFILPCIAFVLAHHKRPFIQPLWIQIPVAPVNVSFFFGDLIGRLSQFKRDAFWRNTLPLIVILTTVLMLSVGCVFVIHNIFLGIPYYLRQLYVLKVVQKECLINMFSAHCVIRANRLNSLLKFVVEEFSHTFMN
eukprot:TRINITY_DN2014_c0_g2_i1.p2 TRINITY_DN2014_c0_g2~~TRINITY_DN2014_c0_g2_i1.p2  ORF type:complete len:248 (-),score=-16.40 TRINITY_DN2014_c0_g2_i1:851-1594(-)